MKANYPATDNYQGTTYQATADYQTTAPWEGTLNPTPIPTVAQAEAALRATMQQRVALHEHLDVLMRSIDELERQKVALRDRLQVAHSAEYQAMTDMKAAVAGTRENLRPFHEYF